MHTQLSVRSDFPTAALNTFKQTNDSTIWMFNTCDVMMTSQQWLAFLWARRLSVNHNWRLRRGAGEHTEVRE